jgi:hypothetical protein
MKCTAEMGSGVMLYIHTEFHKEWFRHSKFVRGTHTGTQHSELKNLLYLF